MTMNYLILPLEHGITDTQTQSKSQVTNHELRYNEIDNPHFKPFLSLNRDWTTF